ncbi:hypothetical protein [Propionibacterium freudenreichii]|uniref:hypothetical protein n=1 Tax=Propionibacterium freudenreichii TaxID=1744 RepID=UPI000542CF60|nr:hypothetical protein [Propionibacterium freudenreichii]MDK9624666.1 hypothetical protein [Propionibacterium freudenreichii]MDK9657145.1 hypothetical protein [Propionibacterium freudenreichii]CEG95898.1 Protein of unknown function [Propionibacterium freudenreichii]CEG98162.1 Protein of unknown function [Propionibacterium freudenreichii]
MLRVDVLTPGSAATPYAAVLAEQGGEWRVMGTLNVDESPTPTPTVTPGQETEPSAPPSSPVEGAPASAAVPSPTP